MSAPVGELALTGERTLPGIAEENYWFRRHEAAYRWLAPFTAGSVLLEAGCGEGYGADLFAGVAHKVFAADNDAGAARHAHRTYPRLSVLRADLGRLPLRAGGVEVVSSLQVVEHLRDQAAFVAECARVLRPAGTLLVTTPNRLTFSPGRDRPLNPFHTRELSPDELRDLLAPSFTVVRAAGLRHGPRLRRWERRRGSIVAAQLAGAPDAWDRLLRTAVRRVTAADFEVDEDGLTECLDLVYVAVRR